MNEVERFVGFDSDGPEIVLERIAPERFRLRRPIRYQDPEFGTIVVPRDVDSFETNLASVPWHSRWLTPVLGPHTPAAILHDALIGDPDRPDYRTRDERTIGPDQADRIFADAMRVTGTPPVRRLIMWSAVSVDTCRKRHQLAFSAWVLVLVAIAAAHAADMVDVIDWLPWLDGRSFPIEWLLSVGTVSVGVGVAGLILLPVRYARAVLVQSANIGLVFFPVLAMVPAMTLLIWLPERLARRGR